MTRKKAATKPEPQEEILTGAEQPALELTQASPESSFPIVGIGASAGGLAAFEAFFTGMPAGIDPGMAFVLVQHLAPDHESILPELIQRYTRMPVSAAEDGMAVEPNRVYVIPPNRDMALLNGTLQLLKPPAPRGLRLPIDFFFRSLAQDLRERAIGVVLSGTGGDGTLGVRAIKGEGGMVMAQNPDSTEYDSMPRSAIGTGLVDYVLPPAEMPAQLLAYVARAFGKLPQAASAQASNVVNVLKKIFILLRAQTGHDFSLYKPSTIHRRIERRMAVHMSETMDEYAQYLQRAPAEADALFRDLLIGVTSFFRDPAAFKALEEQAIPKLFAGKPAGSVIRVWSPGCSTGEEAYSIAILLQEHLEALKQDYKAQVFATDINSQSLATARTGLYPANIAADISPERLARFFAAESDGSAYRVHKTIRDMLLFSEQNVIKDPPFSKIDLIICRNMLIYMGGELQKKLIPLFHYALAPGGFLFLGTSETVGEFGEYFAVVDRKASLFQRKDDVRDAQRMALGRFLPLMASMEVTPPQPAGRTVDPKKLPLRELTDGALLQHYGPVAVLVTERGDTLYVRGQTGPYLETATGEASLNILRMAREGLRRELTTALHKAAGTKEVVRCHGLRVKTDGDFTTADLTIRPVVSGPGATLEAPLYLVILEEASAFQLDQAELAAFQALKGEGGPEKDADLRIATLKQELRAKEEYLQTTVEELETTNEELKSSNEEMQLINEEMQANNEELETSKEELQSINEELATVNAELQTKVTDLSLANNDMNNLLGGTGIATVFLDHQLRILRFTPAATQIINLLLTDVGRPVRHIASNLVGYDRLMADAQAVLDTLVSKEVEVQTTDGKWYTMRIRPYRTLDNVIEGAVLIFFDITEMKHAQELLRKTSDQLRLAVVVPDSYDALVRLDFDGRIMAWNPAAQRIFGWNEAEARAMNIRDLVPEELRGDELDKIRQLVKGDFQGPYMTQRLAKDGRIVKVWLTASALIDETGRVYAIATTERVARVGGDL